MRESEVEKQFVEAVRAVGGQALKFTSQSMNGVPDRLVLLLGGKCAFVELKAPGKQMRILQRKRRQQLEALGFPVFCVDRLEQIQPAVDALLHWTPGEPITKPSSRSPLHSRMQISRRSRMKPPLPRQKRISRWRSPMQRRKPRKLPLPQMHRQRQTANWQKACPIR